MGSDPVAVAPVADMIDLSAALPVSAELPGFHASTHKKFRRQAHMQS
jgi:hypothetical protein